MRNMLADPEAGREKRGRQKNFEYVSATRVMLTYELPLNEIVLDFYDPLEVGLARLCFARLSVWLGCAVSPMVKMDILVSGEPVDALSIIVHRDFAYERGKALVSKMRELIRGSSLRSLFKPRSGQDRGAGNGGRSAQECDRQMLRRAIQAANASCSTSRRKQETDEGASARSIFRRSLPGRCCEWRGYAELIVRSCQN